MIHTASANTTLLTAGEKQSFEYLKIKYVQKSTRNSVEGYMTI